MYDPPNQGIIHADGFSAPFFGRYAWRRLAIPMNQQPAREVRTPQQPLDTWTAWHRTALAMVIVAGLGVGLLAMPTPAGLAIASGLIYGLYQRGFGPRLSVPPMAAQGTLSGKELRTILITVGASLPWLTDALHH